MACDLFRPIYLKQLRPERRHAGKRRDAEPGDRLHHVARQQVIEWHHAPASRPSREELILAIIEAQRQHAEHTIRRVQLQIMRDADRPEPDRKSTRLNSSHSCAPRMPSFALKKKQNTTIL